MKTRCRSYIEKRKAVTGEEKLLQTIADLEEETGDLWDSIEDISSRLEAHVNKLADLIREVLPTLSREGQANLRAEADETEARLAEEVELCVDD